MLDSFKADLSSLDDTQVVNKYYLSGSAFALTDDGHFKLRQTVATQFQVEYTDVFLVGSAKLGFSIKPSRRFQPFADKSDIDVVIVSRNLFERVWQEVYAFSNSGGYWPKMKTFKDYHFEGWIRPDKLPLEPSFIFTRTWWDFFEHLSGGGTFGPYRIRGGLYYSRFFLEQYQHKCFEQCRAEISDENISN